MTEPSDNQGANEQPQQQYQPPQGGWAQPGPGSTQPMYPEQTLPDGMYQPPQQAPQAQPGPYGAPQQPYYGTAPQNPYAAPADPYAQQQQAQYGYPQGQQAQPTYPYPYGQNAYDPNAGYGQPVPPQGSNSQGRNALVATCVAVGVLAVGVCVYWFGFHNSGGTPTPSPIALTTSQSALVTDSPSAPAEPSDTATSTDEADPLSTDGGDDVSALQELMATMSDPGCRSAFQTLITFEQSTAQDSGDDLALLKDYNTAISSLKDAQDQSEDSDASDAINQVITDWKAYTAELASGGTPDDNTMEDDGAQLASACLAAG